MCKSEKGITFMILVITVLILVILISATAGAAISTYKKAKVKVYIEELELIKEKMSLYEDKANVSSLPSLRALGTEISDSYVSSSDDAVSVEEIKKAKELLDKLNSEGKLESVITDTEKEKYVNYRYMSSADLVAYFEIRDTLENAEGVIIDAAAKKVYSLKPIQYSGKECYSVDDIRGK
ncbi:MAG: hypothetical protein HFJ44_00610 [Clostridia bacterium]|jgi:hypothetical protein|nr:hypothetical protein [Clostridia bacterium]